MINKKARRLGKEMFPDHQHRATIDEIVNMIRRQTAKIGSALINPTLVATTIGDNYRLTLSAIELGKAAEEHLAEEIQRCARSFAPHRVLAFYFVVNGLFQKEVEPGVFGGPMHESIMISSMTADRRSQITILEIKQEENGFTLERLPDGRSHSPDLLKLALNSYLLERQRRLKGVKLN